MYRAPGFMLTSPFTTDRSFIGNLMSQSPGLFRRYSVTCRVISALLRLDFTLQFSRRLISSTSAFDLEIRLSYRAVFEKSIFLLKFGR